MVDTHPSPSHHSSVSHPVSLFILCHLSICYMALPLLASGLPQFCETCCPCGLHWVISGPLAGGSPGFRSVLRWFLYSQSLWMAAFVLFCLLCFGLVWPPFQSLGWYHGWYNAITFLSVTDVANWPADHPAISGLSFVFGWLFRVGFWFLCFLVCFVSCFGCVFSFGIGTANRTLYWSYPSSAFEAHICEADDVFALLI